MYRDATKERAGQGEQQTKPDRSVDKPYCPQAKPTAYGQPYGNGLNHLAKDPLSNDFQEGQTHNEDAR